MTFRQDGVESRYSLQHMNRAVFTDPVSLMDNILHVTEYLKDQIREQGGDPHRETLDFVRAKTGEPYFVDRFGEYWRAYHFIEDAYALEETSDPQDFYESAVAFGHFQKMLAEFPADSLTETIAGFHDTVGASVCNGHYFTARRNRENSEFHQYEAVTFCQMVSGADLCDSDRRAWRRIAVQSISERGGYDSLHRDLSDSGWTDKSDEPDLHSGAGQAAQPSAEGVSAGGCQ